MEITLQSDLKIAQNKINCQFKLSAGQITLLQGPNGIGKSSLIHLMKIQQKKVFAKQQSVFVDQFPLQPLNDISFENIIATLDCCRLEQNELFEELMRKIQNFISTPIKNLSGGQNQLVKIGLGLFVSGDIFIFDEPFQFLDKNNIEFFKKILNNLKEQNKYILLVEHRSDLVEEMIDHKYQLEIRSDELRIASGS